jgi:hypothetical protein
MVHGKAVEPHARTGPTERRSKGNEQRKRAKDRTGGVGAGEGRLAIAGEGRLAGAGEGRLASAGEGGLVSRKLHP